MCGHVEHDAYNCVDNIPPLSIFISLETVSNQPNESSESSHFIVWVFIVLHCAYSSYEVHVSVDILYYANAVARLSLLAVYGMVGLSGVSRDKEHGTTQWLISTSALQSLFIRTELYNLLLLMMTLTFIQGHRRTRKPELQRHSFEKFYISPDIIWYAVESFCLFNLIADCDMTVVQWR